MPVLFSVILTFILIVLIYSMYKLWSVKSKESLRKPCSCQLVDSVGWALDLCAGDHGFNPWLDQHLGSLNTLTESALLGITSANGYTLSKPAK